MYISIYLHAYYTKIACHRELTTPNFRLFKKFTRNLGGGDISKSLIFLCRTCSADINILQ